MDCFGTYFTHEQRPKPPWRDLIGGLTWVTLAKVKPWKKHGRERWRKQTCFAKGPRKLTMIEVYLEPDTSNYKRLFQLDDSNSLHRKRSFNQTSILKLLFRLPGIILVCQFFWEFIEKIRESEAKDPRKLRERSRSLHQGLAHSNLNHWFLFISSSYILLQTWMISNLKVFYSNPNIYSNHFPRESRAKDDDARIRSRKQKWWWRKYRERFCERGIWV